MAIIPLDQLPDSQQGAETKGRVIPVDQLPDDSGSQTLSQEGPESTEVKQFTKSPASLSQRMAIAYQNSPEMRVVAAKHVGLVPVGFDKDGGLIVKNRKGETGKVSPELSGLSDFLKDAPGKLADWMPEITRTGGMLGGDAVAGPAGGIAGAAGGEALNQLIANKISGQPMNPNAIAGQAVGAGAGYALGKAIVEPLIDHTNKLMTKLAPQMGTALEDILESVHKIPKNAIKDYRAELKSGRESSSIINVQNSDSKIPLQLSSKTFLGGKDAPPSIERLVDTYKNNVASATPEQKAVIDQHYQELFGLDKQTLSHMENRPTADLVDPAKTDPYAFVNLAEDSKNAINKGYQDMQNKYESLTKGALRDHEGEEISFRDIAGKQLSSMVDRGIMKRVGDGEYQFDPDYNNENAKKTIENIFGRFVPTEKSTSGPIFSVREAENMPIDYVARHLNQMQYELDRAVGSPSGGNGFMTAKEAGPITGFLKELRPRLEGIDSRFKEANESYAKFMAGKNLLDDGLKRGTTGQLAMIDAFKGMSENGGSGIFKDPKSMIVRDAIKGMDDFLPESKKILPKVESIATSQKLAQVDPEAGVGKFSESLQHVHGGERYPKAEQLSKSHTSLDAALPSNSKYLRQAKDHQIAKEFTKPGNLFTTRWLSFMIPMLFGLGTHGPIARLANLGVGAKLASPEFMGKAVVPAFSRPAGQGIINPAQRRILALLARQAMAQSVRKGLNRN